MSILIKGMEMPKSCKTCGLGCAYSMLYNPISDRRSPNCPLVEVVRCKDCRFHEEEQPGMVYCPATVGGWVEENWFCKGGERRSECK